MRGVWPSGCSRQSTFALATALLPLVSSLLLWAAQSVAQESLTNSTTSEFFLNSSDSSNTSGWDSKPVIYVNNPQLLREMQEQSFLRHAFRLSASDVTVEGEAGVLGGEVPLLERAASLASQLRHIANNQLGVTHMQGTFDELPYSDLEHREGETVKEMIDSLERKLSRYSSLLSEMVELVVSFYTQRGQGVGVGKVEGREYHPCCLIPDNYLEYSSHFRTRINKELWCDAGFGSDDYPIPKNLYPAPYNLTELFAINLRRDPTIKWQYFMSISGLHTEYPAHRPGTSVGVECGHWSRHRPVYEATVRPGGRNIVLVFDLGDALTPRLLHIAKTFGYQVLATLTRVDRVAVVGVAGGVARPAASCMRLALTPATHHVLQTARHFIDFLEIQNEPTNHSLGLTSALDLIRGSGLGSGEGALVVYVSRGVVVSQRQARAELHTLNTAFVGIPHNVVVSAVALGLLKHEFSSECQFLKAVAEQNFDIYGGEGGGGGEPRPVRSHGALIGLDSVSSVAPVVNNLYDVIRPPSLRQHPSLVISEPHWDQDSREMVVSLSHAVEVWDGEVVGLVGLDVPLATLLVDVTHFTSPAQSYAFALDARGNVLGHPRLGHPESWSVPLVETDITLLEQLEGFTGVRQQLLAMSGSHASITQPSPLGGEAHYYWRASGVCGWVFVVVRVDTGAPHKRLSRSVRPLPPTALFHRLDLLPPSEARVCRHFNQMATLDGSTLFLSLGSYISPLSQAVSGPETISAVQSVTAFLTDSTHLIANPGIRLSVRTDATALYQIADFWEKKLKSSDLSKYIIRKYAAAPSGVMVMYPGTLMDRSFDPRSQRWYLGALASPGKVVVSPPYLDPGGAGHIVTLSHTIYQGGSATMHSPVDPVVAVLAADFTLGYVYKLLVDLEPSCDLPPHQGKEEQQVRCFVVDHEGYLVAHPSLLAPASSHTPPASVPPHITHQEPVVSMELLGGGGGGGLLSKEWCGRWWHGASERRYSLRLPQGQIVASPAMGDTQEDNTCLQYALAAIPSTNLILGIINQTCSPAVAFCPCSMDDRLCLNCQLVEAGACECPCECPLSPNPCPDTAPGPHLPRHSSTAPGPHLPPHPSTPSDTPGHTNGTPQTYNQIWRTYFSSADGGPRVLALDAQPSAQAPTCPRTPEAPTPLQYSIGLLTHLDPCVDPECSRHVTPGACLGVAGCVWCHVKADRESPIPHPHCTPVHQCYGGVLGGPSPYPHGLATLPHSDNTHGESGSPIGPVAGGIMAVFLVVAVGVYCYRQHVGSSSGSGRSFYTTTSLQAHPSHHPLYQSQPTHDLDNTDEDLLGDVCGVGVGGAAAAVVSPYRMNPGYRRPPGLADSSDQGYSTMTPHDDPDNPHYADLGGLGELAAADDPPSSSGWSPPPSPSPQDRGNLTPPPSGDPEPGRTLLSNSGKRTGPNIIQVPVTVHMVDSV